MDSYSSKKELGIQANKAIKIKSIDGIFIKNFRKIQNQELKMGKSVLNSSGLVQKTHLTTPSVG